MPDDDMLDPTVATIAAIARRPVRLDASARARVMLAVDTEIRRERPGRARHPFGWFTERRTVHLSPLGGFAVAAGLVGIGVVVAGLAGTTRPEPSDTGHDVAPMAVAGAPVIGGTTPASLPTVPAGARDAAIKFVLVAPQASQVTVVGDFNDWNPAAHPMERIGGTWTVTVPLEAGRHEYSFVVDGKHWMPDPAAPLAPDDGFGVANSVLLVSRSTS